MKRLNKLEINPEKVMKNEELLTLRGGYDGTGCCMCKIDQIIVGVIVGSTPLNCDPDCKYTFDSSAYGSWIC